MAIFTLPKSNIIIPQVPVKPIIPVKPIPLTIIKPKVITKDKTKDKTKGKNKIKYEDVYRDPTYYEQFQRFFVQGLCFYLSHQTDPVIFYKLDQKRIRQQRVQHLIQVRHL